MSWKVSEVSPSVGVIIVNWNSDDLLKNCLVALAKLGEQISQTIVIDNSNDSPLKSIPQPHPPNTQFIQMRCNVGFAKANNLALSHLENCEWIALVNPDAFVDLNWMKHLIEAAQRCQNYSFFACQLLKARDPTQLDGAGDGYHTSGMAWSWGHGVRLEECSLNEKEVFAPRGAAALYRREALIEIGGFDEDFFCFFEDVDLAFRLRLAGHRCLLVPNAIAHHVGSGTTGTECSDFSVYHGHRNRVWCFIKNMPGVLFWIFLPLHLVLNFATALQCVFRRQGKIIFQAQWDAVKGIPQTWQKRKLIQASRVASISQIWGSLDKSLWPNRASRNRSPLNPVRKRQNPT